MLLGDRVLVVGGLHMTLARRTDGRGRAGGCCTWQHVAGPCAATRRPAAGS